MLPARFSIRKRGGYSRQVGGRLTNVARGLAEFGESGLQPAVVRLAMTAKSRSSNSRTKAASDWDIVDCEELSLLSSLNGDTEGIRPIAICGKIPKTKIERP